MDEGRGDRRVAELEQQVQQLTAALASNRVTSTAVGLLMAAHHLDRAQAFARLVTESQQSNTKLTAIALALVTQAEDLCAAPPAAPQAGGPAPTRCETCAA